MIRGIHHIGIHTQDLDRLRTFYEQAFGFQQVGDETDFAGVREAELIMGVEAPVARCALMNAGNCFLELFEWKSPRGAGARQRPFDLGYTHFMVDVSDIDAEYKRLEAVGMRFVHPSAVRFGNNASVYGRDPDGNIIEIGEIAAGEPLHLDVGARHGCVCSSTPTSSQENLDER